MKADHGLSQQHIEVMKRIFAQWADRITLVALFGSRAKGKYRPNSDVDLVLYGDIPDKLVDRLWSLFHESSLPFAVDVKSYGSINYPPLKTHIDRVAKPLLTQQDLQGVAKL